MRRVLVCDSASIVQFVLQRYLKDDEIEVDYVKTPRDLTRYLENCRPDGIFLEAEISGGKGRFVCDFLTRKADTRGVPIILSTRLTESDIRIHDLESWPSVRAVIRKPLSSDKVKAEIYAMFRALEAAGTEGEEERKVG